MPRVKPERKAERRAQIIAAARACFAREGFHRTTLQDVFAEAGLSAGCVYNYFKSKEELILAIADERHENERRVMSEGADVANPIQGLRRIAQRFVDDYLRPADAEKRLIAIQTWAEATRNPAVLASVREGIDGPRQEIAALIRRGQAQGIFLPEIDADAVARVFAAIYHGFVLQRLWEQKIDLDACAAVFEHFLGSLRTHPNATKPEIQRRT